MIYKKHTRNQKRMYRIHKMEEQIEKDKYIIGKQEQELERYKNIIDEATNYLLDKYVTGKLDDEEVNNVVRILKGE